MFLLPPRTLDCNEPAMATQPHWLLFLPKVTAIGGYETHQKGLSAGEEENMEFAQM